MNTAHLNGLSLVEQIAGIEASVRAQPTIASHRWALFQLMCVTGNWTRALQQLQTWAKLKPENTQIAQTYRDLIRAEHRRQKVLAGQLRPGFVLEPPAWTVQLIDALRLAADGHNDAANDVRAGALETAPTIAAHTSQGHVEWIADSDSRFGPVCEVITAGHYRWVPFSDLAAWHISSPVNLIDLIWAPCTLTLADSSVVHGLMPARYPGSEACADTLRVGRETVWQESGHTGVIALGQKTWITDQGDFGLFELTHCRFGTPATIDDEQEGSSHDHT